MHGQRPFDNMNPKITQEIQNWLNTPKGQRDIPRGAMLLLKLNSNQVLYKNIIRQPQKLHDKLEYELKKYVQWRLANVTHAQVQDMEAKVRRIAAKRGLEKKAGDNPNEFKKGKRGDHDALPDEIQALYVENMSIMRKMRDLHAQLRIIQQGKPGFTCQDSDKYPFLKELLRLDKQYRDNWAAYDGFDIKTAKVIEKMDSRTENRRALAFINFNKGKYKTQPNEQLRAKLAAAYAKVSSPTPKLTSEMRQLGIIPKN